MHKRTDIPYPELSALLKKVQRGTTKTAKELATKLDISEAHANRILNGVLRPSTSLLIEFAILGQKCDVSAEELFNAAQLELTDTIRKSIRDRQASLQPANAELSLRQVASAILLGTFPITVSTTGKLTLEITDEVMSVTTDTGDQYVFISGFHGGISSIIEIVFQLAGGFSSVKVASSVHLYVLCDSKTPLSTAMIKLGSAIINNEEFYRPALGELITFYSVDEASLKISESSAFNISSLFINN